MKLTNEEKAFIKWIENMDERDDKKKIVEVKKSVRKVTNTDRAKSKNQRMPLNDGKG